MGITAKVNGRTFDPATGDCIVPQWLSGVGAPAGALGNIGDLYVNETNADWHKKTGAGVWTLKGNFLGATGATGTNGTNGNSLTRPTTTIASSAGVVTVDIVGGNEVYLLTLSENVTSWSFPTLPAAGKTAEIRVVLANAIGGTQYTCVNPATGKTAGTSWANSMAAGAIEWLGLAIDSTGVNGMVASGVLG